MEMTNSKKKKYLKKLESRDSVEVVLGELPEEMLDSLDLVVLSPGVPTDLPVVLKMKKKRFRSSVKWSWRIR